MKEIFSILFLVIIHSPSSIKASNVHRFSGQPAIQAVEQEVTDLLQKLSPKKVENASGVTIVGPSVELQKQVSERILEIAKQSPETRARVIYCLIRIVEDPAAESESIIANRWIAAVGVLGNLAATEAIDVLIEHLDQTGENAIRTSIHFRPVVRALTKIGQSAVPKLIQALSDNKPSIRREAVLALSEIGGAETIKAIERAAISETDEEVLSTIKAVLPNKSPQPGIEATRKASSNECADGQIVAATFQGVPGDNLPAAGQCACARAPVAISRMVVKADGSYFVHFRNLDKRRSVVGVSYFVTALDSDGKVDTDSHFHASLLTKATEPDTEMVEDPTKPLGRIKFSSSKVKPYLVQFSSIRFSDGSEWHLDVDCSSTDALMGITCKETKN